MSQVNWSLTLMPTYNFYNEKTEEEFEEFMKISELDQSRITLRIRFREFCRKIGP